MKEENNHLSTEINEFNNGKKKYQHFLHDFHLSNHLIHFYNNISLIANNNKLINELDELNSRYDKLYIENNKLKNKRLLLNLNNFYQNKYYLSEFIQCYQIKL